MMNRFFLLKTIQQPATHQSHNPQKVVVNVHPISPGIDTPVLHKKTCSFQVYSRYSRFISINSAKLHAISISDEDAMEFHFMPPCWVIRSPLQPYFEFLETRKPSSFLIAHVIQPHPTFPDSLILLSRLFPHHHQRVWKIPLIIPFNTMNNTLYLMLSSINSY